ncbi:hypothetical protein EH31_10390 [Erythrobacter longus]|uniref:Acid stress chaperone HdeA n=1 Tax=Erythrobacter longus TaxID=1044 RepID=A0A074MXY4_ERYLO|nr:HdeA/HdeB family chaperone [Erythrobacter longus]KEO90487.1 hypothetical protein EH31_10390 [Erythrobacter longus]
MKLTKLLAGAVLAGSLITLSAASAQETQAETSAPSLGLESDEKLDLADLRCWDVVTLNEDDRGFAMVLLYGYARGEKGVSAMSPRDVQVAVVNTMQECVDKPDAKVLDVLKTHIRS